jgi:hypothetical protein
MEERRRSYRARPENDLQVTLAGHRTARVVDLSPMGARLELATALNPRGECRLALPLPSGTLRVDVRVVHCRLIGFADAKSGGGLIYRAGVEFIGLDPMIASSIERAYPPPMPEPKPARSGPLKVKVDVDAIERSFREGEGVN